MFIICPYYRILLHLKYVYIVYIFVHVLYIYPIIFLYCISEIYLEYIQFVMQRILELFNMRRRQSNNTVNLLNNCRASNAALLKPGLRRVLSWILNEIYGQRECSAVLFANKLASWYAPRLLLDY